MQYKILEHNTTQNHKFNTTQHNTSITTHHITSQHDTSQHNTSQHITTHRWRRSTLQPINLLAVIDLTESEIKVLLTGDSNHLYFSLPSIFFFFSSFLFFSPLSPFHPLFYISSLFSTFSDDSKCLRSNNLKE